MTIRSITATLDFDPPAPDEEVAIQSLLESLADDCADVTFDKEDNDEAS